QVNRAVMAMDDTTQQNAALVEQLTSASQSMKDQAQELLRQVEEFKISVIDEGSAAKPERRNNLGMAQPARARSLRSPCQLTAGRRSEDAKGRTLTGQSKERGTDDSRYEAVPAMSGQGPSAGSKIGERGSKCARGEFEEF
ncbi:MAG: methyl-accepting chemotaxis protein, partial [Nitrospira sp.]|nr:methyl-accepting chemotaxis protein [Nitrospira sp.]